MDRRFGRLAAELAAIEWTVTSTGKIHIEPKEDIKKRLGHSPDHADALALTYAPIEDEPFTFIVGEYDFGQEDYVYYREPIRIL
jgi:hypothetical protein